jgi:hypothetical protein
VPTSMRHRPVLAVLVAVIALLLTVGGTAVAAKLITGKDVKDGSLTGTDIMNKSLTGKDVKNKSLTLKDFKGSVRGPAGAQGPAGSAGAQGLAGSAGATGPAGLVALQYIEGPTVTLLAGTGVGANVLCPVGTSVVSGGGRPMTVGPDVILDSSLPVDGPDADTVPDDGWAVNYNNPTVGNSNFRVNAVCAVVGSVS